MATLINNDPNSGMDNSGDSPYLLQSLDGSSATVQSSTHVTLTNSTLGDTWDLYGTFTAFNSSGQPTAGTATEIDNTFKLTGFNVDVTEFFASPTQANMQKLLTDIYAGDDSLVAGGAPSDNYLMGYEGNDTIDARLAPHSDTLFGGNGNDLILGGAGYNRVNGNAGDDTVVGKSTTGDWLLGGQGNDSIDATHSTGHNILNGNLGADTIHAGSGGDSLRGGQGDDQLVGGAGPDWLSGDLGANTLTGGGGADTFHAGAGTDLVTDFIQGDKVQVDSGLTYQTSQSGADVHIDLSNGGHMVLQNTTLTSLGPTSGWIISS
jgi:Ca2+-binding RTX toxin-like protein